RSPRRIRFVRARRPIDDRDRAHARSASGDRRVAPAPGSRALPRGIAPSSRTPRAQRRGAMNDPERLIDQGADAFERELLASARSDEGWPRALKRAMVVSGGAGAASAPPATATAAATAIARTGPLALLGKGVTIGAAVIGVASVGALAVVQMRPPA